MKRWLSKCFICGHQDDPAEIISYFLFPKDHERKLAWINFAELNTDCDVSQFRLCSKHFADDCLKKHKNKFTLSSSAVPTLLPKVVRKFCESQISRHVKCILCGSMKDVLNVTFTRFPADDILKRKWAQACGIAVDEINHNSRLCCRHFKNTDFIGKTISKGVTKKKLKPNAIPSVQTQPKIADITSLKKSSTRRSSSCIVCGYNSFDVSYHRFPSDDYRRKQWQRICELDGANTKSLLVCDRHFSDSDKKRINHRTTLTNTAVPTLNLVTFGFEEELVSNDNISFCTVSNELCASPTANEHEQETSTEAGIRQRPESDVISVPCNQSIEPCSLVSSVDQESSTSVSCTTVVPVASPVLQAWASDTSKLGSATHHNTTENSASVYLLEQISSEVAHSTPSTSKHLRYFGDVRTPDLDTPRRAERCWDIAKKTIERKNKRIRCLKNKVRKLETKLANMNDLVHHLKMRGKVQKNDVEIVMVGPI